MEKFEYKPVLTPTQKKMLDAICKTNGGGIFPAGAEFRTVKQLEKKGLVQGKLGQQYCAVHTREGLTLWRMLRDNGLTKQPVNGLNKP